MILVAPDKFKGTFTASQICGLVERRLRAAGYDGEILLRPMSDGGEGVAGVLMPDAVKVATGLYRNVSGGVYLAVSSELVGFGAFKESRLPLMERSSVALGAAIHPGVKTYVAIGGTATSDGGAGFLQGLGVKFFDAQGRLIVYPLTPLTLKNVASADISSLKDYDLEGIVDVRAELVGGLLSSLDFAGQKALPDEDISGLADALTHLRFILGGHSEWDGAGGGLGYALASVAKAPCRSGAEMAVEMRDVDWNDVEIVIAGEGHVDAQTIFGGKLVDAVWRKASAMGVPTLVLYGIADEGLPYSHMAQLDDRWEDLLFNVLNFKQSGSSDRDVANIEIKKSRKNFEDSKR